MSNLPTNYVDDVLNADVNTQRKYQMIQNGDGTVSFVDVTDYSTTGSTIGASQINAQNTAINKDTKNVSWYGTCSTAAATTAKVATTSDTAFALTTGAKVKIKFTNANTASAPTLNVDSKGAKAIKAYGTTAPTSWWKAGDIVEFTYDGTNWIMGATQGEIEQINNNLTANTKKFQFAYDSTKQKYGYTIDGEFRPFSGGAILLGEYSANATIDVAQLLPNYADLTADNFILDPTKIAGYAGNSTGNYWDLGWRTSNISKSYNAQTGKLTISGVYSSNVGDQWARLGYNLYYKVYCIGDIESAN